jgi:hypothetical protein
MPDDDKLVPWPNTLIAASSVLQLVPNKPDVEAAADLRKAFIEASKPLLEVIAQGKRQGFDFTFSFGADMTGRGCITQLTILKVFQ